MRRSIAVLLSTLVIVGAIWALTAWAQQPEAVNIEDGNVVVQIDQEKPARAGVTSEDANNVIGDPNTVGGKQTTADAFDKKEVADDTGAPSLANLKAQYNEAENRLAEVADEVAAEIRAAGNVDARRSEKLAERIRETVQTVFEARQALQRAELDDLQRRVAKTQRALAVREQSKQVIIDERTGNLMDEIESGGWRNIEARQVDREIMRSDKDVPHTTGLNFTGPQLDQAESVIKGAKQALARAQSAYDWAKKQHRQGYVEPRELNNYKYQLKNKQQVLDQLRFARDAILRQNAAQPLNDHSLTGAADFDLASQERLLALDAEEAKVGLAEAQAAYDQAVKLRESNVIAEEEVNRFASELKRAKLHVERSEVRLDALKLQNSAGAMGGEPPTNVVDAPDLGEKLLQLDLDEAKLNLSTAQATHYHAEMTNKKQRNSTPKHEMAALKAKMGLAEIQVQRAQTKLDLHKRQHLVPQAAGPTGTDARE